MTLERAKRALLDVCVCVCFADGCRVTHHSSDRAACQALQKSTRHCKDNSQPVAQCFDLLRFSCKSRVAHAYQKVGPMPIDFKAAISRRRNPSLWISLFTSYRLEIPTNTITSKTATQLPLASQLERVETCPLAVHDIVQEAETASRSRRACPASEI